MPSLPTLRAVAGDPGATEIPIHAQPGASKSGIRGLHGDALKVAIAAPPVDGAANAELLRFLAREVFGLPRSAVSLTRGERGRTKVVRVPLPLAAVEERLAELL